MIATNVVIGECQVGVADVPVVIDAKGTLTALGRSTLHIDATATCGEPGMLAAITDVRGAYTAANGDRLRFRGHGSMITFVMDDAVGPIGYFTTSDRFVGGSGRFHDATGQQHLSITDVLFAPALDLSMTVRGSVRGVSDHSHDNSHDNSHDRD